MERGTDAPEGSNRAPAIPAASPFPYHRHSPSISIFGDVLVQPSLKIPRFAAKPKRDPTVFFIALYPPVQIYVPALPFGNRYFPHRPFEAGRLAHAGHPRGYR